MQLKIGQREPGKQDLEGEEHNTKGCSLLGFGLSQSEQKLEQRVLPRASHGLLQEHSKCAFIQLLAT